MDTYIKTTETGAFIRTKWTKDGERHQRTTKIKPNYQKVILGHIGDFEVYVYPYDYPDKVFIGKFPTSTFITLAESKALFGIARIARWYLDGEAQSKPNWRKSPNSRKRAIAQAYDLALKAKQTKNQAPFLSNYNYTRDNKREHTTIYGDRVKCKS